MLKVMISREGSLDVIRWLKMRLYGAYVSPGMRADEISRNSMTQLTRTQNQGLWISIELPYSSRTGKFEEK